MFGVGGNHLVLTAVSRAQKAAALKKRYTETRRETWAASFAFGYRTVSPRPPAMRSSLQKQVGPMKFGRGLGTVEAEGAKEFQSRIGSCGLGPKVAITYILGAI